MSEGKNQLYNRMEIIEEQPGKEDDGDEGGAGGLSGIKNNRGINKKFNPFKCVQVRYKNDNQNEAVAGSSKFIMSFRME